MRPQDLASSERQCICRYKLQLHFKCSLCRGSRQVRWLSKRTITYKVHQKQAESFLLMALCPCSKNSWLIFQIDFWPKSSHDIFDTKKDCVTWFTLPAFSQPGGNRPLSSFQIANFHHRQWPHSTIAAQLVVFLRRSWSAICRDYDWENFQGCW